MSLLSETPMKIDWVVIRFDNPIGPVYAILDGWEGKEPPHGDHYKLSTAIIAATTSAQTVEFTLSNGSVMKYDIEFYRLNASTRRAWQELQNVHRNKVWILPSVTAWEMIAYV